MIVTINCLFSDIIQTLIYIANNKILIMFTASDLKAEIEKRLQNYLSRDTSGIRRELLAFLLKLKTVTVNQVYTFLSEKFTVSLHSVASMLGTMASKLGILSIRRERDGDAGVYELRPQYITLVERLLNAVASA
ncbi:MAG: DUF2551 domain-containing protein [Lachnospiraceae bacterium]|nr:DUF2551 domain-containing protein [Lachnospiraceae bacterium]